MLWLSEVTIKSINRINYPTIQQFLFWFIQPAFNWLNIPSLSFKCQFCRNHHLALSENRLIHSKLLIIPSSFIIIFPTKLAIWEVNHICINPFILKMAIYTYFSSSKLPKFRKCTYTMNPSYSRPVSLDPLFSQPVSLCVTCFTPVN